MVLKCLKFNLPVLKPAWTLWDLLKRQLQQIRHYLLKKSFHRRPVQNDQNAIWKFLHVWFSTEKTLTVSHRHTVFFKGVRPKIPLCTASVTDRKAHSCILIWSFTEHMERKETPSSSMLKLMVHCATIWNTIIEWSECLSECVQILWGTFNVMVK